MNQLSFADLERWRPVPGWEGLYEASDKGRARSLPRMAMTGRAGMKLRPGRVLKPHRNPHGYLYVNFSRPGFRQTFQVHVLVMLTFAGPCPEGKQVRHLNGVPDDNRWAPGDDDAQVIAAGGNLIYGTPKKNAEDRDEQHGRNFQSNKTHCPQDHEYTEENTYVVPTTGVRQCKTCRDGGRPAPPCSKCGKPAKSHGLCGTHDMARRRALLSEEERAECRRKDAERGRLRRQQMTTGGASDAA